MNASVVWRSPRPACRVASSLGKSGYVSFQKRRNTRSQDGLLWFSSANHDHLWRGLRVYAFNKITGNSCKKEFVYTNVSMSQTQCLFSPHGIGVASSGIACT